MPVVIPHRHLKALRPQRNLRANTAQTENADALARHLGGWTPALVARPFPGAYKAISGTHLACRIEQQRKRHIRHTIVQHTGRIPHTNATREQAVLVELVKANAKAADKSKVRKRVHHVGTESHVGRGHHVLKVRALFRKKLRGIGLLAQHADGIKLREFVVERRQRQRTDLQDADGRGGGGRRC